MTEKIKRAAIEQDGVVYALPRPARHHDVIAVIYEKTGEPVTGRQGFLTNHGRFVDRKEGLEIATKAHQIIEKTGNPDQLFSEDLW